MPSRVGRVTSIFEDGTIKAINENTNEEWFGRLIVMSGGMVCFDLVDERLTPMGKREIHPEHGGAKADAKIEKRRAGEHVKLGGRKERDEERAPAGT
jgi:hypothetical protein